LRFTAHRPASAEVSPCCHRPPGGDIACGVHVSVARARTAGDAQENRLTLAVFGRDMPAGRASLRRVRSWNEFDSPRSFVLQPGNQQSPPVAVNLTVEAPFLRDLGARALTSTARRAGHSRHIQILDADGREATRHIGTGLFHPVTAAISFTSAQPGNRQLRSCPPVRTASRPGKTPLQPPQSHRFTNTKARNIQQVPGGQRHRHRHAAINANHAAIVGSRDRFGDGGKSDVPAPRPIQSDAVGLHRVGDGAGRPEPHPSHFRYPYLPIPAAQLFEVARFESDLPKPFVFAGLTPGRATMGSVEKVAHRLCEVPQRLLLHGLRPGREPLVFGAGRRQLGTLIVVIRCSAARLPVLLLLDGQVPHKPGMATMLGQYCRLLKARKQPKPTHTDNIGARTDNTSKPGTRRFLPRLQPRVSTPQIR
jgi:hypothetical protein